ncbi:unnamed protein product [Arctogadus glacialis]
MAGRPLHMDLPAGLTQLSFTCPEGVLGQVQPLWQSGDLAICALGSAGLPWFWIAFGPFNLPSQTRSITARTPANNAARALHEREAGSGLGSAAISQPLQMNLLSVSWETLRLSCDSPVENTLRVIVRTE